MNTQTEVTTTESAVAKILGADVVNAIGSFVGDATKKERSGLRLVDQLRAADIKAAYMKAPKKDEKDDVINVHGHDHTRLEVYNSTRGAIVLGFSKTVQQLLDTPANALPEHKKVDKKKWQMQIGSRMSDLFRLLSKSEAIEAGGDANTTKKDLVTKLTELVNSAKDKAQKAETPDFDVTAFVKAMDSGLAALASKPAKK